MMLQDESAVVCADCIFSDLYGRSYPFHVTYEASVNFIQSTFQNIDVGGGLLEVASGGIGRFTNSTFQNVHTPDGLWVTSTSDDHWVYSLERGGRREVIQLEQPQRDVVRRVIDGDRIGNTTHCSEVYIAEEDVLYDQSYGLLDYDPSTGVPVSLLQIEELM